MATEHDIARAVMSIAAAQPDHVATFKLCYKEIPSIVPLDAENTAPSSTRNGEPMWHQLVRNIQSHHDADDNYIMLGLLEHIPKVGYRITARGLKHLGN